MGNQMDMNESSIPQNSNIEMNAPMTSLSYPKIIFPEIKLKPRKIHRKKFVRKLVIIRKPFLLSTYRNIKMKYYRKQMIGPSALLRQNIISVDTEMDWEKSDYWTETRPDNRSYHSL